MSVTNINFATLTSKDFINTLNTISHEKNHFYPFSYLNDRDTS